MRLHMDQGPARAGFEVAIGTTGTGVIGVRQGFDSGNKIIGLSVDSKTMQVKASRLLDTIPSATGKVDYEGNPHVIAYGRWIGLGFITVAGKVEAKIAGKLFVEAAKFKDEVKAGSIADRVRFVGEIVGAKTFLFFDELPNPIELTSRGIVLLEQAPTSLEIYGIKNGNTLVRFTGDSGKEVTDLAAWDEIIAFIAPITGLAKLVTADHGTAQLMTVLTTDDGKTRQIDIDGAGIIRQGKAFITKLTPIGGVVDRKSGKIYLVSHGQNTLDGLPFAVKGYGDVNKGFCPYLEAAQREYAFYARSATA